LTHLKFEQRWLEMSEVVMEKLIREMELFVPVLISRIRLFLGTILDHVLTEAVQYTWPLNYGPGVFEDLQSRLIWELKLTLVEYPVELAWAQREYLLDLLDHVTFCLEEIIVEVAKEALK